MSAAKHTPGPWKECGGQVVQAYAPYDTIATTYDDRKATEDSANAKLIAAAPDMAEALLAMRKRFDFEMSRGYKDMVDAALAKAGL